MTDLEKAAMRPVYILSKWIGYKEKSSPYNLYSKTAKNDATSNAKDDYTLFNQYFDDLYKKKGIDFYGIKSASNQGAQWCDITVHWAQCMAWGPNTALQVLRTSKYKGWYYQSRACKYSKVHYVNSHAWIKGDESNGIPKVGDQVFFFVGNDKTVPNHTGIVSQVTAKKIRVIEGNAGKNARFVVSKIYDRKASNIDGYGRPNYNLVKDWFKDKEYDELVDLTDALMLTDATAIAAVKDVMGITDTSEEKKYALTQKQIEEITNNISKGIKNYKQAIEDYNAGTIEKSALKTAQRTFENLKKKYNDYAEKQQNKITNFKTIKGYIEILNNTQFPNPDDLKRKSNLGSTDWFTRFQNQYNNLISNFYTKINNLYLALIAKIQNGLEYNVGTNADYKFKPQDIPKPNETKIFPITFFWATIFEGNTDLNYSTNRENYLKDYTSSTGKINYDAACYNGYIEFLKYYNEKIEDEKNKLNAASIDQNIKTIIQCLLNILQIDIYKLYAMTYGGFTEKEENGAITYSEKIGIAYNFGGDNTDYINFYNAYKDSLFGNKLYLKEIFFNVRSYIKEISKNFNNLNSKRNEVLEELGSNEQVYRSTIKDIYDTVKREEIDLVVDWREIIYQMAKDYYNYANNPKFDYDYELLQNNSDILQLDNSTGYEVFYTDLLGFWRQLYYNPLLEKIDYSIEEDTAYAYTYLDYSPSTYWNNIVSTAPSNLNFWFDLTEGSGEINNYQISMIGDRLKATKDTKVTALYQAEIPNIIYYDQDNISYIQENAQNASYSYFQLGGPMLDIYTISSQGRSAIDLLQEQLYKFIYCVENVTITTLPVYTLLPNYRIMINSKIPGLSGEYIITKYNIPFTYNATMSITATKAVPYIGING